MGRLLLMLLLLGVLATAMGAVVLGAFPPEPQVKQVQKVLPNDRFVHAP